jgi:hypothetical protein
MEIEFKAFGKIPRLFRDITITEKIDGSNAAIGIQQYSMSELMGQWPMSVACPPDTVVVASAFGGVTSVVYAQSRKRIITPGKNDNHGFAGWVWDNARSLSEILGPGLHYGEWWGSGINRGYGLEKGEKRFSLFNTKRWGAKGEADGSEDLKGLGVVPVLYEGPFSEWHIRAALVELEEYGSSAAPGFMQPEGIIVYHHAGNTLFKATILNDEAPKETLREATKFVDNVTVEPLPEGVQEIYGDLP